MKKIFYILVSLAAILIIGIVLVSGTSSAAIKGGKFEGECTTIQDGTLLRSDGELIVLGFDEWGYNYQARLFSGGYCDAYRDAEWCQPYKDIELQMEWSDEWLSNKDCDGDGLLDRHYGFDSYIGSGAWLTNHMRGDGWTYFVGIAAKPTVDYQCVEEIWGSFCVLQRVSSGEGSTLYEIPGFGIW